MKDDRLAILLTGMGIGAAAGLLFARYSGVELRKQITRRAGEAKTFLKDQTEGLVDRVAKAADEVGDHFSKGTDKAKAIIEDASSVTTAAAGEIVDKSRAVASQAGKVIEKHGQRLQNI